MKNLILQFSQEQVLTKHLALKKSVCRQIAKQFFTMKEKEIEFSFYDENIEWGGGHASKLKNQYFNRYDVNISFEYVNDNVDVATDYGVNLWKNKLDFELDSYEVTKY